LEPVAASTLCTTGRHPDDSRVHGRGRTGRKLLRHSFQKPPVLWVPGLDQALARGWSIGEADGCAGLLTRMARVLQCPPVGGAARIRRGLVCLWRGPWIPWTEIADWFAVCRRSGGYRGYPVPAAASDTSISMGPMRRIAAAAVCRSFGQHGQGQLDRHTGSSLILLPSHSQRLAPLGMPPARSAAVYATEASRAVMRAD